MYGETTTKEARLALFHAVAAIDRRQDFRGLMLFGNL